MRRVWDKFAFISTVATSTSYTDKTYGGVLGDPADRADLDSLLAEFQTVAAAKGIVLSEGIAGKVIAQMERIPADTTTSMQRDFRTGADDRARVADRICRPRGPRGRSDADLTTGCTSRCGAVRRRAAPFSRRRFSRRAIRREACRFRGSVVSANRDFDCGIFQKGVSGLSVACSR